MRRHGRTYLLGLLSQAERKTSWQLAEFAGDASPDGVRALIDRELYLPGTWAVSQVRDDVRRALPAPGCAGTYTGVLLTARSSRPLQLS